MKQFFLTMGGVFAGLVVFFIGLPILLVIILASSAKPAPTPANSILSLDLRTGITDQAARNPLAFLSSKALSVAQIVQGLHQAETAFLVIRQRVARNSLTVIGGDPDRLGLGDEIADRRNQPGALDHHTTAGPFGAKRVGGERVRRDV